MRKLLGTLFLAAPLAAGKGSWDVGGKLSLVEYGDGYAPKVTVYATYRAAGWLDWRNDLEMLTHVENDSTLVDMSAYTNLLARPLMRKGVVDPYFGPGLGLTGYDNFQRTDWSGRFVVGLDFLFIKGKTFGIEATYTMTDLPSSMEGSWEVGLTGSWEFEF